MSIRLQCTRQFAGGLSLLASVACLTMLAGCVADNGRMEVGNPDSGVVISSPTIASVSSSSSQATDKPPNDKPSLTSLSRSDWDRMTFVVPVDGAGYRPLYTTREQWDLQTSRQRGEFPTPASALEGRRVGYWRQTGESFATAGYAFGDFLLMLVRMVPTPPWEGVEYTEQSVPQRMTTQSYWRAPVFERVTVPSQPPAGVHAVERAAGRTDDPAVRIVDEPEQAQPTPKNP